ncbi:MAG: phosphoenolpyruvate carboxykinase (ATP) [Acidobacteria bacterium]|nr:phosphoenolpyruvate carboxykinase (ATP) [Acidobacteriota bacterium]
MEWTHEEAVAHIVAGAQAHWNLEPAQLVEEALRRREGVLAREGALVVRTGEFTGRSPQDKYIVREASTEETVDWGTVNQPMSEEQFEGLFKKLVAFLEGREVFIQDCSASADPRYALPLRVVAQKAWHALFAHQMFVRRSLHHSQSSSKEFAIFFAPELTADPSQDGTRSGTCIAINFKRRIVLITGTFYAGELKKAVFTIMNHFLPVQGVLPMHCSANISPDGQTTAVFFGLSGTGKTTLSADPRRPLVGDDEHGWSEQGIFNIEGGCYAKCIGLSRAKEPQIWDAIGFGVVLENVVIDPRSRQLDYASSELTENSRAAYPIENIPKAVASGVAGHPAYVVLLTADAFGVLPPIARLTPEQAIYHFLSGYTAKVAGTERGLDLSPAATFSACFAAPFLSRPAQVYARMLGEKLVKHGATCYLVNTGWTGGPYGIGRRIDLQATRAMVNAILEGNLDSAEVVVDPVFGLAVPRHCPGVPGTLLNPRTVWNDKQAYDRTAVALQERFARNSDHSKVFNATLS